MVSTEYYVVRRGSTSLSNKIILSGLSYEAIGLLMTELSLRPGTPLGYRQMVGRGAGRQRVLNAHKELEQAGLRHRFLFRSAFGELRTLVVVTDDPCSSREVLDEIPRRDGDFLVRIETDFEPVLPKFKPATVEGNGRQNRRSRHAPVSVPRCDQGKRRDKPKKPAADKTAGRTVVPVTAPRSTGAGRSPNTLRVKDYPSSPPPPKEVEGGTAGGVAAPLDGGVGGEVLSSSPISSPSAAAEGVITPVDSSEVSSGPPSADSALVYEVLPEAMWAVPVRDHAKITAAIRQRLATGWSRKQITEMLAARCLPDHVRHLTALVLARFRDDIPVGSPPPRSGQGTRSEWSYTLTDGRIVTRRDIDFGLLAIDFRAAQAANDVRAAGDRLVFAEAVGVERYVI